MDRWRFESDTGQPVTLYPDPGTPAEGTFSQPGQFALLVGDHVEGYLFLDSADACQRPAQAIDGTTLGIQPDLDRLVTAELNAALEKISASGGGTLALGPGIYETGTVRMQSGVYLFLDAGAVLQATLDMEAHPLDAPPGTWSEDLPREYRPGTPRRLIYFEGVEDSGLLGPGVVCGQGSEMRRLHPGPRVIGLDLKDGAQVHDVAFSDIHVRRCNRPFDIWVIPREGQDQQTQFSTIRNVSLENVRIEKSGSEGSNQTSHIMGRPDGFDVQGVRLRGLEIDGKAVKQPDDMDVEINEWVSGVEFY